MSLDTYDDLKSSLIDTLDRDDLAARVDDFIDLAESRHKRDIRIREMLVREPLTIDDRYVDIPAGYLQAKTLRILTNQNGDAIRDTVLDFVNEHEMNRIRRDTKTTPRAFAVHVSFEFNVQPDQDYGGEIIYYKALTPLSDNDPVNALLTRAPDAYLYGSLLAAAPFLDDDERVGLWAELYSTTRDRLREDDQRALHPGPLISRVDGATP